MDGDRRLGRGGYSAIEAALESHSLRCSVVSLYEFVNSSRKPRWPFPISGRQFIEELDGLGIVAVPVSAEAAALAAELPLPHGDPLDRLIAATAVIEKLTLVTADHALIAGSLPCPIIDARL